MNDDPFHPVRIYSKNMRDRFAFSSEQLEVAPTSYVAWLDLMGAGHLMKVSTHKTANFIIRLHMAVDDACAKASFQGRRFPINDGIFLISADKAEVMKVLRHAMGLLAAFFIATPRPHDRFFVRGGIAFGPVYYGSDLLGGIKTATVRNQTESLKHVAFGPPVIQAYSSESTAPPFGIAVHESARAFAPKGNIPFRLTHWLWWQATDEIGQPVSGPPLTDLKDCLAATLIEHFSWMHETLLFHNLPDSKIKDWEQMTAQYFRLA